MRIVEIIKNDKWINEFDFFKEFKESSYYDILLDTYENLNTDILYKSNIHGQSHIERVIFFALVLSWKYDLDKADTDLMRYAASLHDTKRVNDGWDIDHGRRAANESIDYANIKDEDKPVLQAIMTAHSSPDTNIEEIIYEYDIKDYDRALFIAKLFKDSDGLDRVRIDWLDPKYLRNDFSLELVDFAYVLYDKYWLYRVDINFYIL